MYTFKILRPLSEGIPNIGDIIPSNLGYKLRVTEVGIPKFYISNDVERVELKVSKYVEV